MYAFKCFDEIVELKFGFESRDLKSAGFNPERNVNPVLDPCNQFNAYQNTLSIDGLLKNDPALDVTVLDGIAARTVPPIFEQVIICSHLNTAHYHHGQIKAFCNLKVFGSQPTINNEFEGFEQPQGFLLHMQHSTFA
jgi:hypothetical protein